MGIFQGTVQSGATDTDHYSNQTKQEEKQAGVSTADILLIAIIGDFEADTSFGRELVRSGLRAGRHAHVVHTNAPLLQYGDKARSRGYLLYSDVFSHVVQ